MNITKTTLYHQNGYNISVASIDRIKPNKWWISRVNVKSAMLKMAIEAVLEQEEVEIVVAA